MPSAASGRPGVGGRACSPRVRDVRRAGSAALDLCAVAAGWLDGYVEHGCHWWDWAAAALVAAESGAVLGVAGGPDDLGPGAPGTDGPGGLGADVTVRRGAGRRGRSSRAWPASAARAGV